MSSDDDSAAAVRLYSISKIQCTIIKAICVSVGYSIQHFQLNVCVSVRCARARLPVYVWVWVCVCVRACIRWSVSTIYVLIGCSATEGGDLFVYLLISCYVSYAMNLNVSAILWLRFAYPMLNRLCKYLISIDKQSPLMKQIKLHSLQFQFKPGQKSAHTVAFYIYIYVKTDVTSPLNKCVWV